MTRQGCSCRCGGECGAAGGAAGWRCAAGHHMRVPRARLLARALPPQRRHAPHPACLQAHNNKRQGHKGLGKSTTLKIAGGKWVGSRKTFDEEGEEVGGGGGACAGAGRAASEGAALGGVAEGASEPGGACGAAGPQRKGKKKKKAKAGGGAEAGAGGEAGGGAGGEQGGQGRGALEAPRQKKRKRSKGGEGEGEAEGREGGGVASHDDGCKERKKSVKWLKLAKALVSKVSVVLRTSAAAVRVVLLATAHSAVLLLLLHAQAPKGKLRLEKLCGMLVEQQQGAGWPGGAPWSAEQVAAYVQRKASKSGGLAIRGSFARLRPSL